MRILHIITKLDVGGAQSVVLELARAQRNGGHHVAVATGLSGPVTEQLRNEGVEVNVLDSFVHPLSPARDRQCVKELAALIRAQNPDVVHTHSSKGGLLGRLAARRCSVPSVYTAHGWPFQPGAPRSQQMQSVVGEWIGGRVGDEIVCVTEAEGRLAERLRMGRSGHRHVIANGIADRPPLPRTVRQASEPLRVVMVARLSPPKRPDILVDALALLPDDVVLTIVGDGELATATEQRIGALGLNHRVTLVGIADPLPHLASAHVFCLVSDYEGMPITVLEAMRAGLPVVANRLTGIAEAVNSNDGSQVGIITEANPQSVAAALDQLRIDPMRAYEMGQEARRRWEAHYTAASMAARYQSLYESTVRTTRRP